MKYFIIWGLIFVFLVSLSGCKIPNPFKKDKPTEETQPQPIVTPISTPEIETPTIIDEPLTDSSTDIDTTQTDTVSTGITVGKPIPVEIITDTTSEIKIEIEEIKQDPKTVYLIELGKCVDKFKLVVADIDKTNKPWENSGNKLTGKARDKAWIDYINKNYNTLHIGNQRQITQFTELKTTAKKLSPPKEFKKVHDLWIKSSELGVKRIELSDKNMQEEKRLQKNVKWTLQLQTKSDFEKTYKSFLNEYKKAKKK